MLSQKHIKNLKFEPKNQILAARFTKTEAEKIRQFCQDENIPLSQVIRYSFKQIIPNL
jgi:hypothetical protein